MKIKNLEAIIILLLWLFTIYFWSLPFQENRVPYGDVDSSTHFTLEDYMGEKKNPVYYLPYYLLKGGYEDEGGGKLWYPPQFHTFGAILQIMGGERILPILLFHAIASSAIIFTSYFFIRKLFGFIPALASSIMLVFSKRDILWYLWGQYPQVLSFALIPLIAYTYYKLLEDNEGGKKYLYLLPIILAIQFFIHAQALFTSFFVILIYTIFITIKKKKIGFNLKETIIFFIILIVLLLPFYSFPLGGGAAYSKEIGRGGFIKFNKLNTLFHWYGSINEHHGVPDFYYSFRSIHGLQSFVMFLFFLLLLLIGLIFLLIRRENKDILLIALFISFFISSHDLIFGFGRAERFLEIEAFVLYPIVVLGIIYLSSFVSRIINFNKTSIKFVLIIIFIMFFIFFNFKDSYNSLKEGYAGILRLTPFQLEAADWMKQNLPENSDVLLKGTAIYAKKKWIQAMSFRHMDWDSEFPDKKKHSYVLLDYSDYAIMKNQKELDSLQQFEKQYLENVSLIWQGNQNLIKVYKLES